jgi:outer membrane protein assembly factor BamB
VRAYDPSSGAVLWEDRLERPDTDVSASSVAVTANRIFVSGSTSAGSQSVGILRVYNAATGALEWEQTRGAALFAEVKVVGRRLFLAGSYFDRSYLGVFDTQTGATLWEDSGTEPGGIVRSIAIEGDHVVAVGGALIGASSGLRVQSYNLASGQLDWVDHTSLPPGFFEFGGSVATNGRVVYVAGAYGQDIEFQEIMVRAYDATTGRLLWDDRSHRSGRPTGASGIALGPNRLFVAGFAWSPTLDFVVRAYDIRHDGLDDR